MTAQVLEEPRFTPPRALNRLMEAMLKTPGLQRLVGRSTALLTYTGRRSGRRITTPVSYVRIGDEVIITCHRARQWWRNMDKNPGVELRLAGRVCRGWASVLSGEPRALDYLTAFLEAQPAVARMSDVAIDEQGRANREDVKTVLSYTVVVAIELDASR